MIPWILLTVVSAFGCTTASDRLPSTAAQDGRMGLHGMVVYGTSSGYFLEHIPMLHPPHDYQIVAKVTLRAKDGRSVKNDFSGAAFTLKPSEVFSLDEYVAGSLTTFVGTIYEGSFEQEGRPLPGLESVNVEVEKLLLVRKLPMRSPEPFFEMRDQENVYRTRVITPTSNIQKVDNMTAGKELWCVRGPDFFDPC